MIRLRAGFCGVVPWGSEHMSGIEQGLLACGYAAVTRERVLAWRVRSYG